MTKNVVSMARESKMKSHVEIMNEFVQWLKIIIIMLCLQQTPWNSESHNHGNRISSLTLIVHEH